jgi:hypothetical protein
MDNVVKKANKIKSIKEILDFNGDGTVSKNEIMEAVTDEQIMERIKKLNPMFHFLMKNQNFKLTSVMPKGKPQSQRNLVKQSVKNFKKDKYEFDVEFKSKK